MPVEIEQKFGFLLGDASRSFGTLFDQHARERIKLPRAQCRVVVYLSHFGEMNQVQLASLLEVTPMTVARLLNRMEMGGWVTRIVDPADRRSIRVVATASAECLVEKIHALGDEVTATAMKGLTSQEKRTLIDLMVRVKSNIINA